MRVRFFITDPLLINQYIQYQICNLTIYHHANLYLIAYMIRTILRKESLANKNTICLLANG